MSNKLQLLIIMSVFMLAVPNSNAGLSWNNTTISGADSILTSLGIPYLKLGDSNITQLQENDTVHDSRLAATELNDTQVKAYANATFLPISTYSGNFPNSTISTTNLLAWNATWNSTVDSWIAGLKINDTTHDTNDTQLWTNASTQNTAIYGMNLLISWLLNDHVNNSTVFPYNMNAANITSGTLSNARLNSNILNNSTVLAGANVTVTQNGNGSITVAAIGGAGADLSSLQANDTVHDSRLAATESNDTQIKAYANNTFLPISTYSGNFPNTSISTANMLAWNATWNSTIDSWIAGLKINDTTYDTRLASTELNDTQIKAYVNATFVSTEHDPLFVANQSSLANNDTNAKSNDSTQDSRIASNEVNDTQIKAYANSSTINNRHKTINYAIFNSSSAIQLGLVDTPGDIEIPWNGTFSKINTSSRTQANTISYEIWVCASSTYPCTVTNSIGTFGKNSSVYINQSQALSTAVYPGYRIMLNVTAIGASTSQIDMNILAEAT